MIGITDALNILALDLRELGHKIYKSGDKQTGVEECIVLNADGMQKSTYFKKAFINVNYIVPNFKNSNATNYPKLNLFEDLTHKFDKVGVYKGIYYKYSVDSVAIFREDNNTSFLNTRILFEILNVNK